MLQNPILKLNDYNMYKTLDHRPNKIDYIITSPAIDVCCKPVDVFDIIEELFPYLPLIYYKVVLDHDSLAVNVTIPNQMSSTTTVMLSKLPNQLPLGCNYF